MNATVESIVKFVFSALIYSVVLYAYGKWLIRKERASISRIRAELELIEKVHKMKQANIPVPEYIGKEIEEMCK